MPGISIGELSRRTGVNIETIRYFEKVGIIATPSRTHGGHRVYDEGHVRSLGFIRRARELGFTLAAVRALLALSDREDGYCAEFRDLTMRHLLAVRAKLADLRRLERGLAAMVAGCGDGKVPECPVLDALRGSAAPRSKVA